MTANLIIVKQFYLDYKPRLTLDGEKTRLNDNVTLIIMMTDISSAINVSHHNF